MLSLHTHQPLLIQLHATIHYRRSDATTPNNTTTITTNTPNNPFHSQKLPPVTFAADTVIPAPPYDSAITDDPLNPFNPHHNPSNPAIPSNHSNEPPGSTPPDLFLRSLDMACLARVRALTRHTAFCFGKPVNYEVERAFVWAGVGDAAGVVGGMGMAGIGEAGPSGVGNGVGVGATASLSIRGLSSAEIARQVDMMRRRGYRDWVRVDMGVEIEAGRELREREEVGWLTGARKVDGEVYP